MVFRSRPVFVAALWAGIVLAPGCADDQNALVMLRVPDWPMPNVCAVDPNSEVYLPRGVVDVAFEGGYVMPGALRNDLRSRDPAGSPNGIDDAILQMVASKVWLSSHDAPEIIDALAHRDPRLVRFKEPYQTVAIPPAGLLGVLVEVVPPATVQALREELAARPDMAPRFTLSVTVVFEARRSGSKGSLGIVESRSFIYPIEVCVGCLIDCGPCPEGECPAEANRHPLPMDRWTGGVCGYAQDFPLHPTACVGSG